MSNTLGVILDDLAKVAAIIAVVAEAGKQVVSIYYGE